MRVRPITGTELISRLSAVGLREDFEAGELYCASCGAPLNIENVGFVTYDDSRKGFRKGLASCVDEECVDELLGGRVPNVFVRPNAAK